MAASTCSSWPSGPARRVSCEQAEAALKAFAPLIEGVPDAVKQLTAVATLRFARGGGEAPEERTVTARLAVGEAEEDGGRPFRIALRVASGWHVNANPASRGFLVPTAVRAEGGELLGAAYPPPAEIAGEAGGPPLAVYQGEVEIAGRFRPGVGEGALAVTCQPCDEHRCLAAVEIRLPFPP